MFGPQVGSGHEMFSLQARCLHGTATITVTVLPPYYTQVMQAFVRKLEGLITHVQNVQCTCTCMSQGVYSLYIMGYSGPIGSAKKTPFSGPGPVLAPNAFSHSTKPLFHQD